MKLKFSNERIDEYLKGKPIVRMDDFARHDIKMRFKCLIDNHIWLAEAGTILYGSGCPMCSGNIVLTDEMIDKRLEGSSIQRIGNIVKGSSKLQFRCLKCEHVWIGTKQHVCTSKICPACAKRKHPNVEMIDKTLTSFDIKRVSEFTMLKNKLLCECAKCNYQWNVEPDFILKRMKGCPRCLGITKLNNDIVDERLKAKSIARIDPYVNGVTKIRFMCLTCEHIWEAEPRALMSHNRGCPNCRMGKNEKRIGKLIKQYVKHELIKPHHRLVFNNRSYLPDYYLIINGKPVIIEYNGHQHYMPVTFGVVDRKTAIKSFRIQKKRDEELRIYCKAKSIPLIEISYNMSDREVMDCLNYANSLN